MCATNDINSPHRLGAALTYARRYALFTIVGIAGEDDLDAPDLQESRSSPVVSAPRIKIGAPLPPERSAAMRDLLLSELAPLSALDDLTLWTLRHLNAKGGLQEADAEQVNLAYLAKLQELEPQQSEATTLADDAPRKHPSPLLSR